MLETAGLIQLLLARLERISADSPLAHRASGVRGSLLRALDAYGQGDFVDAGQVEQSIEAALDILRQAAGQVRTRRRISA